MRRPGVEEWFDRCVEPRQNYHWPSTEVKGSGTHPDSLLSPAVDWSVERLRRLYFRGLPEFLGRFLLCCHSLSPVFQIAPAGFHLLIGNSGADVQLNGGVTHSL